MTNYKRKIVYYPTELLIKELYRVLKIRKRFGTFINYYFPLKGLTYIEYNDVRGQSCVFLTNDVKMVVEPNRVSGSFQDKILTLKKILSKSEGDECKLTKGDILEIYVADHVSKYCETNQVIPNNMAHGFYYGVRMAMVGTTLIYLLMLYLLPIGYTLVLIFAYFYVIVSEVDV